MIRKVTAVSAAFLFLITSAYPETFYLKDGKLLRAKITDEDETTFLVETETEWKRIRKSDVEMIKKDNAATEQDDLPGMSGTETVQISSPTLTPVSEPKQYDDPEMTSGVAETRSFSSPWSMQTENVFKIAFDMAGSHDDSTDISGYMGGVVSASGSSSRPTDMSISLSAENVYYTAETFGLGYGATVQLPRKITGTTGMFYFMPIYGLAKIRTKPSASGAYQYIQGQLGYDFFFGNEAYRGTGGQLAGGLFYGIGAGLKFGAVQLEILHTVNSGTFKQNISGYDGYYGWVDLDIRSVITYPQTSFTFGICF